MASASLPDLVAYCDERTRLRAFADFPGSMNGLQVGNRGRVKKVGAAVDAGLVPFRKAAAAGVEFLIVHHGLFWGGTQPVTGASYERLAVAMKANCAVYSSHLPLDAHPELGNNARLCRRLGLEPSRTFLPYQGNDIGLVAAAKLSRPALRRKLAALFAGGVTALEFGSERPPEIAFLTGSGTSAVDKLRAAGVDTLVTGELKQSVFNLAQEEKLNLYCCGHYATEVFGVQALAAELAEKFGLPWEFIDTECPL